MNTIIKKSFVAVFIIPIIVLASYTLPFTPTASACSYMQGTFFPTLNDIIAKSSTGSVHVVTGTISNTSSLNGDNRFIEDPLNVTVTSRAQSNFAGMEIDVAIPDTLRIAGNGSSCNTIFTKKYLVITAPLSELMDGEISDSEVDYVHITQHDTAAAAQAEANRIKLLLTPTPTPSACDALMLVSRRIVRGQRGENVRALQQSLNRSNYGSSTAQLVTDGVFGRGTLAAVLSFQAMNNLTADGIVGPKTIKKMCENNPLPI